MIERGHVRILMLEDNPQDVFLLRDALSRAGFQPEQLIHAERLADALRLLADTPVNLILTDLNLPDSTGLETVRVLAQKASGVPILVLTGHSDSELERELLQHGARGQLSKDLLLTPAIAETIQRALEGAV